MTQFSHTQAYAHTHKRTKRKKQENLHNERDFRKYQPKAAVDNGYLCFNYMKKTAQDTSKRECGTGTRKLLLLQLDVTKSYLA